VATPVLIQLVQLLTTTTKMMMMMTMERTMQRDALETARSISRNRSQIQGETGFDFTVQMNQSAREL